MLSRTKIDENELNKSLQKRLLWVLVLTGCIANMAGFISNALLFGMSLSTIVCGVCEAVMIICSIAAVAFDKQKISVTIMVLMISLIEFPFLFYVYGAGMGVYLILGIVALSVYFPRPYHIPAIIATIVLDVIVIFVSYFYPSNMGKTDVSGQFGIMHCSYILVAVAVAVIICNLISQYALQHKSIMAVSRELEWAAQRDALTGVYNRGYLIDVLNQWMDKEHGNFLAALIDIDNFKNVNDTYGHLYGDEVLKELARLMEQEMSEKGIVARYGGEEFMILFENADYQAAKEALERVKSGIKEYSLKTRQTVVTFSCGMQEYCADSRIDELFHNADMKLYQAKNKGKNQIVF